MHWRDRFSFCMEAVQKAPGRHRRGEGPLPQHHRRHHGGNVPPRRVREGDGLLHRDDRPDHWLTAIQSISEWRARTTMILHLHRAGHSTYTRQKKPRRVVPRHLEVVCDWRAWTTPRRHGGRQARGDPLTVQGFYNVMRDAYTVKDLPRGLFFDQDWAGLRKVAAGGLRRHPRRPDAPAQSTCSATTWCCSFGGGTIGHPMGIQAGATRTGSRSRPWCSRARRPRHHQRGPADPRRRPPRVPAARGRAHDLEGRHVQLRLDRHLATSCRRRASPEEHAMRITQGTFSFLPDLTDEQIGKQVEYGSSSTGRSRSSNNRRPASPQRTTGRCGACDVST